MLNFLGICDVDFVDMDLQILVLFLVQYIIVVIELHDLYAAVMIVLLVAMVVRFVVKFHLVVELVQIVSMILVTMVA